MSKPVEQKNKRIQPLDSVLAVAIILLLAFGIVMVLSASSPTALAETGNSYAYFYKQLIAACLGVFAMFALSFIDYRIYKKLYKFAYFLIFVCLAIVPIMGYGAGGAKRWINLGVMSFQPSEAMKIFMIIFLAGYCSKYRVQLKNWWDVTNTKIPVGFGPLVMLIGVPLIILVITQTHLSATIVIGVIAAIILLVSGARMSYFVIIGVLTLILGGTFMYLAATYADIGTFRIQRITTLFNPWADPLGAGWQTIQGLYAIGSGGLFGVGLGNSMQKYLYISEPQNDYIFAVVAEELGFIGCVIILILFAIIIWRGIVIALNAKDLFGTLVAVGITSLIAIQLMINIGVVTATLPVTGMSLPFVSYGGSSLLVLLATMGILLNISRSANKV